MVRVDISADSKFPVNRKAIRERVARVLLDRGVREKVYVSVTVVGDRKMGWMNKQYRGIKGTTDVLSFPTSDPGQKIESGDFVEKSDDGLVLGDVVVSYPQAVMVASRKNQMLDEAVGDLVEHGMLHLLGIHHD